MEPNAARGAGLLLLVLVLVAALPRPRAPPPAIGCPEAELVELQVDGRVPELACSGGPAGAGDVRATDGPGPSGPRPGEPPARGARAPVGPGPPRSFRLEADGRRIETAASAPIAFLLGRKLDVNVATELDLEALPGIGPALARRIVGDRDRKGPFVDLDDLHRVYGIGPSRIRELRGWAVASGRASR
jgi:competence protein ComEA